MNKSYKSIWNESLGTWVAVSEISGARGKPSRNRKAAAAGLALALLLPVWSGMADANVIPSGSPCVTPKGGTVGSRAYAPSTGLATDGTGTFSTVAGCDATGDGRLAATVFGANAGVSGEGATAVGFDARAAKWSTAIGLQTLATGESSTVVGHTAEATGLRATALGQGANASGQDSTALGQGASALVIDTTAVGHGASAMEGRGTAVGAGAKAGGLDGTALGRGAVTGAGNSTALGSKASALGNSSTAVGYNATTKDGFNVAVGVDANAGASTSVAVGSSSTARGDRSVAVGPTSTAGAAKATAVGSHANALGLQSTALGDAASASGQESAALGQGARASADFATAVGADSSALGPNSTAVGSGSKASVESATALGRNAAARGRYATALGEAANANTQESIALGQAANALGDYAVAAGSSATASGLKSIALGFRANATMDWATAVGHAANASGQESTALGEGAAATSKYATALGSSTNASGERGTAVGYMATATQGYATAVGTGANASGPQSTALGEASAATKEDSIAAGSHAQAIGLQSTALGAGAKATQNYATASGNRANATGLQSTALGQGASAEQSYATAVGQGAKASGQEATALGQDAGAGNNFATAVGSRANASTVRSTAVGYGAKATQEAATAVGSSANASGPQSIAMGFGANARGAKSISVGTQNNVDGASSAVIGNGNTLAAANAFIIGNGSTVSVDGGMALGNGAAATAGAGVAGHVPSGASTAQSAAIGVTRSTTGAVAVGNAAGGVFRQVTGVAAGTADSDAVNVSQLKAVGQAAAGANAVQYDDAAKTGITLGGATSTNGGATGGTRLGNVAQGSLVANSTDAVNGSQLSTTNSNVAGLGNSLSTTNSSLAGLGTNLSSLSTSLGGGTVGPVQVTGTPNQLALVEPGKTGTTPGAAQQLTNIAPGRVVASGTDAVSGGQLFNTNQAVASLSTTAGNSVQYGGTDKTGVSFGGPASTDGGATGGTKLTNVAQGSLAANSTDAVNGSQLSTTNSNVAGLGNSLSTTNTNVAGLNSSLSTLAVNPLTFKGNSGEVARRLGDTLEIAGTATTAGTYSGANLRTVVDATTGTVNIQMAQAPVFDSVAMPNGTKLDGSGLTINGGPKVTTDGIDAGGKKIGNVGPGTADGDVANFGQIKGAIAAANTAASTAANSVQYDDAGKTGIKLGGATSTDGGATNGTKLTNVAQGSLRDNSTDAVNGSQLSTTNSTVAGLGNSLSTTNSSLAGLGSNLSGLSTSLGGGTIGRVQATGTTNQLALVEPGMTGAAPGAAQQLTNVAAGRVVANGTDAVNGGQLFETNQVVASLSTTAGNSMRYDNPEKSRTTLGGLGADGNAATSPVTLANVADGRNANDAVNFGQLSTTNTNVAGLNTSLSTLAASPLTFKGNSGEVVKRLGDTLTIAGTATTAGSYSGANLRTVVDATTGAVNLQMAQAPVFDSVAMPNGTKLDGSGLTINGGPKVTTDGIDAGGKRIGNMGSGTENTDAANVGQVREAVRAVNAVAGTAGNSVQYADAGRNRITLDGPASTNGGATNGTKLTNVAQGLLTENSTDAVNGSQLSTTNSNLTGLNNSLSTTNSNVAGLGNGLSTTNSSLSALSVNPLTFKGNSGEVARRLGDTLTIRGDETTAGTYSGANLRTMIDAATGAVNLQMAQSPVFDAVAMPNGTRLDGAGLSINGGPKVTTDGIDAGGKRISNVVAGTADSDVVNFGQVKQAIQNANAPVGTGGHLVQYDDPDEDGITLGDSTSTNGGATGGTKLTNLAQGALTKNSTDAVNGSQLSTTNSNVDDLRNSLSTTNTGVTGLNSSLSTLAVNPLTFKGNSGEVAKKLGDTLSIIGAATTAGTYAGANLKTVVDATTGAVNVQMAQAPVFDSVAMPNGTKLDGSGLTINGGPKVTTDGIDAGGKKIGNVGAGTADGDVANFGQIKDAIATANAAAGTAANAVQYDDASKTGVKLGGANSSAPVKLSNVADGSNANDAVNFGQLSNLGNGLAGTLGGTYAGGVYQAPTFTTIGGPATTVQGALTNLGNAVTQGTAGPVQTAGMPNQLVLVETGKSGAAPGAAQTLTNLASGTVAKDSKDAVNGGQLFTLQEDIKSLNGNAIKFDGADKARATLGGKTSTDGGLTNGTKLSNVAQGAVGQGSTDAVNGAQLHATNTAVADHAANTSAYLGGGADVAAGKAPAYAVQGGSFNNVGAALGAVDQNLSTLNSTVSTLGAAAQNAVQYDGKDKGGVTLGGAKSTDGGATNGTKIGNVAQGNVSATSTEAINGAQLAAANRTVSDFIGGGADATTGKAPAFAVQGTTSNTVGGAISAIDGNLNTINNAINGNGIKYVRVNSTQADATARGQDAIALGPKAVAAEANTIAIGNGATAERAQGTAIGFNALVQQTGGVALGAGSVASTAAGLAGYVPAGASAQDTAAIKATTSTQGAVSVGDAANGQFRQITGVAAGTADSDAANVAQVRASVGEARAGSTQYDRHADGTTNYGQITLGNGQAPDGTRISNVAPGVQGTDAVNVNQLAGATAASANYTDARVNAVKNRVEQVARDAYAGVASAMAVQMPGSSIPGKTVMRMGAANFKGQSAVGISFRRTAMNNGWSMTGGVGVSRAGAAMTVGAEWVFE